MRHRDAWASDHDTPGTVKKYRRPCRRAGDRRVGAADGREENLIHCAAIARQVFRIEHDRIAGAAAHETAGIRIVAYRSLVASIISPASRGAHRRRAAPKAAPFPQAVDRSVLRRRLCARATRRHLHSRDAAACARRHRFTIRIPEPGAPWDLPALPRPARCGILRHPYGSPCATPVRPPQPFEDPAWPPAPTHVRYE